MPVGASAWIQESPRSALSSENENVLNIWVLIFIPDYFLSFVPLVTERKCYASGVENHCSMPCLSAKFLGWCKHAHLGVAIPLVTGEPWICLSHTVSTNCKKTKLLNHCMSLWEREDIYIFYSGAVSKILSYGRVFLAKFWKAKV